MHSHKTGALDSERTYLALTGCPDPYPHSACTIDPLTRDAIFGDGAYHGLFEQMHIILDSETVTLQINDRVYHQLSGTVKGHITTALYAYGLDAPGLQDLFRKEEV